MENKGASMSYPFREPQPEIIKPPNRFNIGDHVRVERQKLDPYEGKVVRIVFRHAGYTSGHYFYFIKTKSVLGHDIVAKAGEEKIVRLQ